MSAGTFFGKYFLLKRIAQGGMGEIYIARQQGPGGFSKVVALKKILPHLTENEEFVQSFLGEAALAAKMGHRNIVTVFDFGLDDDSNSYFLTMEYVAGKALNQLLEELNRRNERLPVDLVQDLALQICEGMSYAHNLTDEFGQPLQLVHRDLNPANVLVSYTGDAKVIDWGIAKSELSQVKTEAGMIKGKFVYMSPEQSMAKKLDKRSDVFAAGITLYEMLVGENPFHKPNVVLSLEAIQRHDPAPPSSIDPNLAPFDPIVAKALAKDRDRRYQDCAEMAEDLRHIVTQPSGERLGQYLGRLFRSALEEEQKLLMDTGSRVPARPSSSPGARIPSSPGMRSSSPGVRSSSPGMRSSSPGYARDDEAGATMMLSPGAPGAGDEAGSTMMVSAPGAVDEDSGSTLVVGDAAAREDLRRQMDSARRRIDAQRRHTPAPSVPPDSEPRTMFIGAPDFQPPPAEKPPRKSSGVILGIGAGFSLGVVAVAAHFFLNQPEREPPPALAAPAAAEVKRAPPPVPQQPERGAEAERPRPEEKAESPSPEPRTTGQGGAPEPERTVEAAPKRPDRNEAPPVEREATRPAVAQKAPEPRETVPARQSPPAEEKAPAPAEAPKKPAEPVKVASAQAAGTLLLRSMPSLAARHDGREVSGQKVTLSRPAGSFTLGDEESPFKVALDYRQEDGVLKATLTSDPWSIAYVNNLSRGKVPLQLEVEDKLLKVELKRPGVEQSVTLILRFTPQ